ncbi:MAG: N-acetylneuraminate synthase [Gammaproteobacteria bacterium]|nr:N-acetylneuraminate synthase [Gammaproteobacteria bacterium]
MVSTEHTFVIAEAGVNHNGSLELALQLVDAAATAGADAVKFQTFVPEALVSRRAAKAVYQQQHTAADESQLDMLRKLALSHADHLHLRAHCRQRGIEFLSSPFDIDSAHFLVDTLGVSCLKLGSGEITNGPLLLALARSGKPLILSTGMSTLEDIEQALALLAFGFVEATARPTAATIAAAYAAAAGRQALRDKVSLLHCTTEYPCPFEDVNLRAMDTLREAFGLVVGYSDHTPGINVPIAAVARGARIIEKHFTLDRSLPGPDHQASLQADELRAMLDGIRQIEHALGHGRKEPAPSELKNRPIARKALVAARPIRAGEIFTVDNLTAKRPAEGLSPMRYWDVLDRPAERDYLTDEAIAPWTNR